MLTSASGAFVKKTKELNPHN